MQDYFEYKDGTFWAIRTKGSACYTVHGSKYEDFWPCPLLLAGTKEAKYYSLPPSAIKKTFPDKAHAEEAARKMIRSKAKNAVPQTPEFWHTAVELDGQRLFFVPDTAKTAALYKEMKYNRSYLQRWTRRSIPLEILPQLEEE